MADDNELAVWGIFDPRDSTWVWPDPALVEGALCEFGDEAHAGVWPRAEAERIALLVDFPGELEIKKPRATESMPTPEAPAPCRYCGARLDRVEELLRRAAKVVDTSPETPMFAAELTAAADELAALVALPPADVERVALQFLHDKHPCSLGITQGECDAPYGLDNKYERQPCCVVRRALTPTEGSG